MQLREKIISNYFPHKKGEPPFWRWTPPEIGDFVGPADLARVLIDYRARIEAIAKEVGRRVGTLGDVSDKNLETLLRLAYKASFRANEGRATRATLFSPHREEPEKKEATALEKIGATIAKQFQEVWEQATSVHQFSPSLLLKDERLICQLAPTLRQEDAVLVVKDVDADLAVTGISLLDHQDTEHEIWGMPRLGYGASGLFVRILAPGHLRVEEDRMEYSLAENELVVYESAIFTEPVRRWLHEVSTVLAAKCQKSSSYDSKWVKLEEDFPDHPYGHVDITVMWSRILRDVVRLGHGGALAVVPKVETAPLTITYRLTPYDLGTEMVGVWLALCELYNAATREDLERKVENKRQQTHHLFSACRSIAHLSASDGCVVFDRALVLHGFGGSINARPTTEKRKLLDLKSKQPLAKDEVLRHFGERHKSAYYLCHEVPGAIVFVVSQDGNLRLFASDEDAVYFADNLHP